MSEAGPLIFILVMLVVFYLFLLRPQRAQQKQMRQLQTSLEVGHEVVLSAGIFGTVRGLDDATAEIEIAPGTVVTVARQVVVRRVDELPAGGTPAAEQDALDEAATDDRTDGTTGTSDGRS